MHHRKLENLIHGMSSELTDLARDTGHSLVGLLWLSARLTGMAVRASARSLVAALVLTPSFAISLFFLTEVSTFESWVAYVKSPNFPKIIFIASILATATYYACFKFERIGRRPPTTLFRARNASKFKE